MGKVKDLKLYKECLIVVDMVNGFIREGVLRDEKIARIIPTIVELIEDARKNGKLIVFVKDCHNKNSVEFERFGNTHHCLDNSYESELVQELKAYENLDDTVVVKKNSTSFMESPDFRKLMEEATNIDIFDVVGCCTDICVFNGSMGLANYLDEGNRKHTINVYEDAIATFGEENRSEYVDAAKLLMKQQGIKVLRRGGKTDGK